MYWASKESGSLTLIHQGDGPDLSCTSPFWAVIETLPKHCAIPAPIVKLGVLSRHIEPAADHFEVDLGGVDIESTATAVVPPQTLARVRWMLSNHTDHLSASEKKAVGELCTVAKLNQPPEMGESKTERIRSELRADIEESAFLEERSRNVKCEHCGAEYESVAALNGHLANCDERETAREAKKSATEEAYHCEYCDESFSKKLSLRVHKKRNCDEKQPTEQTAGSTSGQRPAFGKEIRKDSGSERISGRNPFADPDKLKDTGVHQGGN
ncbi:C2H2-type zinc finger protein [Halostagnicola larsenii]|uniref:C2H2-type zinc finger protein n=1 Tax=Halostagnicola larsenii TaxID=353800 RepID=UPI0012F97DBD|nr:hypothetical protein [Halostagnicola larsenii]